MAAVSSVVCNGFRTLVQNFLRRASSAGSKLSWRSLQCGMLKNESGLCASVVPRRATEPAFAKMGHRCQIEGVALCVS